MLLHYQPTHDNKVIRLKFASNKDRQTYVGKYQHIVALMVQINETIKNAEDEKSKSWDKQSIIKKLNIAIELHDDLIDSYGANCLPDKFIHGMHYAQIALAGTLFKRLKTMTTSDIVEWKLYKQNCNNIEHESLDLIDAAQSKEDWHKKASIQKYRRPVKKRNITRERSTQAAAAIAPPVALPAVTAHLVLRCHPVKNPTRREAKDHPPTRKQRRKKKTMKQK
jgi:hypothetical protein